MPSGFLLLSSEFFQIDLFRNELGGVSTVFIDIADHAGTDADEFAFSEQKHRLELGVEAFVSVADHILILEVATAAEAADDESGAYLLAEVGGEAVVALHHDVGIVSKDVLAPFDAVLQGEGGAFLHVDAYGDVDDVEHRQGAQHDGAVPEGDGIEGSRKDSDSFHS